MARAESTRDLIVAADDQPEVRELLQEIFAGRGRKIRTFSDGDDALAFVREQGHRVGLVLLDLEFGPSRRDGLAVLRDLREVDSQLPVVILTGKGSVDAAVAAVKAGADDFVEKDPYLADKLELLVDKIERSLSVLRDRDRLAVTARKLERRIEAMQSSATDALRLVGHSAAIEAVLHKVVSVARLPRPVLILGERGTGKELVAHAIHRASPRADHAFVVMNCAAVTQSLLESELFGHEKGAFTGATDRKAGKFELADEGTLFLDEVGNMSLECQAKILRVLEYQRFQRVAGSAEVEVDVRVIAATNADLDVAMREGGFRRDLYDRLAFEVIRLPPLRERREDIAELAQHFVERFAREVGGLACTRVGAEAAAALGGYDFPGNVRELKNIVERAAYAARGEVLQLEDIRAALPATVVAPSGAGEGFEQQVESLSRQLLTGALARNDWNQKQAAEELGLTYDQFRHLYRKYDIGHLRP